MKTKFFTVVYLTASILGIFILCRHWFSDNTYIVGHDSGLALNTWEFLKSRTYAWSLQNFGQDNSPHFGSLVMYTIDFITSKLAGVPYGGNFINVFFWISAIYIAGFIFANSLKKELGKYFPYFFAPFITINFFIIQSLFVLERAKYSVLVANLLILTVLLKLEKGSMGYVKSFILIVLIFFFFNCGSWLGSPLYGSTAVLVGGYLLVKLIGVIQKKSWVKGLKTLLFWFIVGLGFILVNAYSVFPYISTFIKSDAGRLISSSVVSQNKEWLRTISQAGSYINFLRLEGVPDWYSGQHVANIQHPFAGKYLSNPFLILVSFIFPVLAIISFIYQDKKSKKILTYFLVFTLLGLFFMAGSHSPLGFVYEFLYSNVPGFAVFRSPYFKFASAFLIGYIGLISFSLSYLTRKFGKRFSIVIVLGLVALWLLYHGVIFDRNRVFSWQKGLSTRLLLPVKLEQFSDYLKNSGFKDSRVLLVPPVNLQWQNDAYDWGYWSLTNLPSVLSPTTNFVINDGNLSGSERFWVNELYKSIEMGDENHFNALAKRLDIKYILLRGDVLKPDNWSGAQDPGLYLKNLNVFDSVSPGNSYSDWQIFAINSSHSGKFTVSENFVSIPNDKVPSISNYLLEDEHTLSSDNLGSQKFRVENCRSCTAELKVPNDALPEVTVLPNSKLYFIKEVREKNVLLSAVSAEGKAFDYLGFALRRTSEVMTMMRSDVKDSYTVSSLHSIESYLGEVYEYLTKHSNSGNDFSTYARLQDSLLPIETNLRNLIGEGTFNKRSDTLRKGVYSVLWKLHIINNYFLPISDFLDIYRERKVFSLNFKEPGNYRIHLGKDAFPSGRGGEVVYPEFLLVKTDRAQELKPVEEKRGVYFEADIATSGTYEAELVFNNLPNLYQEYGYSFQPTPFGNSTCQSGGINFFNKNSSYMVSFSVPDKTQKLTFYVRTSAIDSGSGVDFLRGDVEKGIDAAYSNQFSYLYKPYSETDPVFYVCKNGRENPLISEIKIYEIINPGLIIEKVHMQESIIRDDPIDYKMIDPTEYEVNIDSLKNGEILLFNEKYSPLWQITKNNQVVEEAEHVNIDGYANGWMMPVGSSGKYVVKYMSQKEFLKGAVVTFVSLSTLLLVGIWKIIFKK